MRFDRVVARSRAAGEGFVISGGARGAGLTLDPQSAAAEIAAEMVAASRGLGFMVLSASKFMVTDVVIMGILVIGALALAFDMLMRWMEAKLVPWKGR